MSEEQQNLTSSGVLIMNDSEFSNFELYPMDMYAFCMTVNKIPENEKGIPMVIESVSSVREKVFQGNKKPAFSFKMVPQEPIKKAYIKQIVDGKRKDKKTGEMVDAKVYKEDKMGEHITLKSKDYDKPINVSITFKKKRTLKCDISEEFPEGKKEAYVVSPLASSFPFLNFFLQNGGHIPEGNKRGFAVPQDLFSDLENFEFMAGCEIMKIEGLSPYQRVTASEIDYDFDNDENPKSEKVENEGSDEKSVKDEW